MKTSHSPSKTAGLSALLGLFCASILAADSLPNWNDGPNKTAILEFVEKVTDPDSPGFVPKQDRIAVFDNDGTLWCEQPIYTQVRFALDRVKAMAPDHPEWRKEEPFKSLLTTSHTKQVPVTEEQLIKIVMATHAGMTTEEFADTVKQWIAGARHPRFDRLYTDLIFQPMLELIGHLESNGFHVFIVSGGGVEFMRPWTERVYGIPPGQVVGSVIEVKYEVRDGKPVLVREPKIDFIDDKAGKPVGIHKFIGKRPPSRSVIPMETLKCSNGPRPARGRAWECWSITMTRSASTPTIGSRPSGSWRAGWMKARSATGKSSA